MKQEHFFDAVKKVLNVTKEAELKSQIAEILEISESGAYKKIKSITQLTIEEMYKICDRINYKIEFNEKSTSTKNHPFVFHCDD